MDMTRGSALAGQSEVAVAIAIAARVKRLSLNAGMEVTFRKETLINATVTTTVHPFLLFYRAAFAGVLKKHKQPVGLMASLKESVSERRKPRRTKKA